MYSPVALGNCWQSWHRSRPCSPPCEAENQHFCLNLQCNILCVLVFLHFSERVSKGRDADAAKNAKFEKCGYLWLLPQSTQSAELNNHLSSGRDLLRYLYILLVLTALHNWTCFNPGWTFILSIILFPFGCEEVKIWYKVKKHFLCDHVSIFSMLLHEVILYSFMYMLKLWKDISSMWVNYNMLNIYLFIHECTYRCIFSERNDMHVQTNVCISADLRILISLANFFTFLENCLLKCDF